MTIRVSLVEFDAYLVELKLKLTARNATVSAPRSDFVWQHVRLLDVSLGTRLRNDQETKQTNNQT